MGIPRSKLRMSIFPFLHIVQGMKAYPLGNIDLPVTSGDRNNFRTETLIFEVVVSVFYRLPTEGYTQSGKFW
jgi:hypothetical protein